MHNAIETTTMKQLWRTLCERICSSFSCEVFTSFKISCSDRFCDTQTAMVKATQTDGLKKKFKVIQDQLVHGDCRKITEN
jgi:hypothetical protein